MKLRSLAHRSPSAVQPGPCTKGLLAEAISSQGRVVVGLVLAGPCCLKATHLSFDKFGKLFSGVCRKQLN